MSELPVESVCELPGNASVVNTDCDHAHWIKYCNSPLCKLVRCVDCESTLSLVQVLNR